MLSRSGIHLIRALVLLSALPEGEFAGAASLAESIGAPQNYLGKLLQALARQGLVESRKGLGGGFRLARDPATVTLLDVIDPIEHISRWKDCILGNPECADDKPCPVHDQWAELRERYVRLLSSTSLAEIVMSPDHSAIRSRR